MVAHGAYPAGTPGLGDSAGDSGENWAVIRTSPRLFCRKIELVQAHTILAPGRLALLRNLEVLAEVGRIAQPHGAPVGRDELGGDVHEIRLAAKLWQVVYQPPRSGESIRLQDHGVVC